MARWSKGDLQRHIELYVNAQDSSVRLTPYRIAEVLSLSPSSVTAACKSLIGRGRIACHGTSPLMVGPIG